MRALQGLHAKVVMRMGLGVKSTVTATVAWALNEALRRHGIDPETLQATENDDA